MGKLSHLKRHHTVYCACSLQAASGKGPSLESLAKILVGEGLPVRKSHQKTTWTFSSADVTAWKSGQLMLDTLPHSNCWALQETHLPGIEEMAAAQRWSRKRGWAAAFHRAEVVGQHYAANRVGVAIAGPLHAARVRVDAGRSGCLGARRRGAPLHYLRSRILARHTHVTLVTVYLEPGMRASGLNLWLLEVLAACILCFDGPWIAMGDWNLEPQDLSQAGWLNAVNGKVLASSTSTCAGGEGSVLDYFVVSEAVAHLVQQVEVIDISPTTPHWPVRLTLNATSWGHRVLARKRPKPITTEVRVGPQRQEEHVDWTWAAEETPSDLELAWLELRAAEAAWCRIHDLFGAQRRPFLGRSKGLVIERISLGQATRNDTEKEVQQKGRGLAATLGCAGGWQLRRLEEGADLAVHGHGCFNLVARPWPLGSRMDFSLQEATAHTLSAQCSNLWGLGRPGHTGYAFHQESNTTSSQCCGCRFGALLEAMGGNASGCCQQQVRVVICCYHPLSNFSKFV